MSIDPAPELIRFQQFISDRLKVGATLSPEEALDLWRLENPEPDDSAGEISAIQEALDDMDGGDTGVPLEEFEKAFRQRHGLIPGR